MNGDQDNSHTAGRWTIRIEKKTVSAMIRIYCGAHHRSDRDSCPPCAELLSYSHKRLDNCVFGVDKPSCRECPVHCYRAAERETMKQVMRFAGPKMLLRHPVLAVVHLWKEHSPFRRRPEGHRVGRRIVSSR
jgi:Nitrous oxide-stimulated promoter